MRKKLIPIGMLMMSLMMGGCIQRPAKVLSDARMAPVVADLELADSYMKMNRDGVSQEQMLEAVLYQHGIDRATYDSTMAWYERNPDVYYEFCDKVQRELAMRKAKYAGAAVEEANSSDLWPYSRMVVISQTGASDGMEFNFPASTLAKGARLRLRMNLSDRADAAAILGVEYDNGVRDYALAQRNNKNVDITFQADSARTVTRIFGNLMLGGKVAKPLWVDSISLTALPFDSLEYHAYYSQRTYRRPQRKNSAPKVTLETESNTDPTPDSKTE